MIVLIVAMIVLGVALDVALRYDPTQASRGDAYPRRGPSPASHMRRQRSTRPGEPDRDDQCDGVGPPPYDPVEAHARHHRDCDASWVCEGCERPVCPRCEPSPAEPTLCADCEWTNPT